MSVNPATKDGIPIVVSTEEFFLDCFSNTRFYIESGNGYPGTGGCYYGKTGKTFVSKYRIVYVESHFAEARFRAFSLPLYALSNLKYNRGYFGSRTFTGTVAQVPRGGLASSGTFTLTFNDGGLTAFQDLLLTLLDDAMELQQKILAVDGPAIALLPLPSEEECKKASAVPAAAAAYLNPSKPNTVYLEKLE